MNSKIIFLLSTMGTRDEIFKLMQQDDILKLAEMLTNKEVALSVMGKFGSDERKTTSKMLLEGYEPSLQPYLLMILLLPKYTTWYLLQC